MTVSVCTKRFAAGLAELPGVALDLSTVETNIVRFRLTDVDTGSFVDEAHRRGVHMLPSGGDGVRAVFYLDIGKDDVDAGLAITRATMRALANHKKRRSCLPYEPAEKTGAASMIKQDDVWT